MKSKIGRLAPELYDLLNFRKSHFHTSMTTEQRNLVKIMQSVEKTLGIDMKSQPVTKDGVKLSSNKKVLVFK